MKLREQLAKAGEDIKALTKERDDSESQCFTLQEKIGVRSSCTRNFGPYSLLFHTTEG